MTREEEIVELLKHLLGKVDKAIDNNQFSNTKSTVINSATSIVTISKDIENYINELNELTSK